MSIFTPPKAFGLPLIAAVSLLSLSSAQAALIDVSNGQIYDDDLNVYWVKDANFFKTLADRHPGGAEALVRGVISGVRGVVHDTPNAYDNAGPGNYRLSATDFDTTTGAMNWWGAQAFVTYVNSHVRFGDGATGWRLPTTYELSTGAPGSELRHLFFNELGGRSDRPITSTHARAANYDLFQNVRSDFYWLGDTEYPANAKYVEVFSTATGRRGLGFDKTSKAYVWSVRTAPVAVVPLPGAWVLFASASAGLGWLAGSRKKPSGTRRVLGMGAASGR
ncbi:DUF1566 domain-containing protein [Methylococcus sp. EFPC2]|uniref:Lcl domain-containing protein n=1 Tax=Methylococcus sp. EFPC2 TaxID=2812648 RepID=UPI0019673526|nr:DUF1566 domain-containing protein [Methylococcus sp. EFPC2]QSA96049.1 DUF1566 domain-containing protein [Methylococcus sp. EFPC2]